ncbi:MAG: LamG domain-containing protein [Marinilabiliales bacterium]|nr:LamG domain-containing protein [Marinilabiliales bacterium]
MPSASAPSVDGGSLTLEGWLATGAYPWNWAPIVQQGDNDGYFLGINSHGYPGFMVKVNGVWEQLTVPDIPPFNDANHMELFKWYHVAGTYNKADGRMSLFLNGKEIAGKQIREGRHTCCYC